MTENFNSKSEEKRVKHIVLSRFIDFRSQPAKEDVQKRLEKKAKGHDLYAALAEFILDNVPAGRNQSEALTNLETSLMFAGKAIMQD